MRYVVGVDGGGTKTTVILVDETGQTVREVSGGTANVQVVGLAGVIQEIVPLVTACAGGNSVDLLCAGIAGAGRQNDREGIRRCLKDLNLAREVVVISDAHAALIGAHKGKPGLILIAGTGSIALGMNHQGKVARSGGWGYLLGDEGSGYDIGRRAISACLMAKDHRGQQTALSPLLLKALGIRRWDQIVRKVYGGSVGRTEIAALAPIVFDVARRSDHVAARIIEEAGRDLGLLTLGVLRQLGTGRQDLPLALIGGLFMNRDLLLLSILTTISDGGEYTPQIVDPAAPPAYGAAIWGFQQIGVEIFV